MKLSDWAEKQGIAYLTAYRWFKAGKLPVKAYQSESGTIIVQDDSETLENSMNSVPHNDVMTLFLKKTVEFSKNNATVEDFAAFVLSNFSLKMNNSTEPKYSRNKPRSEEIQNHFKQFIPAKGEKPKPNMFVAEPAAIDDLVAKADTLTAQELVEEIHKIGSVSSGPINTDDVPEVNDLFKDLSVVLNSTGPAPIDVNVTNYGDVAGGIVTRSVDLTPQQLNYTGSTSYAFSNSSSPTSGDIVGRLGETSAYSLYNSQNAIHPIASMPTGAFKPTQKEIESASQILRSDKPRRGRKSHKKIG